MAKSLVALLLGAVLVVVILKVVKPRVSGAKTLKGVSVDEEGV